MSSVTCEETKSGDKYYRLGGQLHRDKDLPAVEYADGIKVWCRNGLTHRDIGPAIVYAHRSEWWQEGGKHRTNGPAVEYADGGFEYWLDGELHREDEPACVYSKAQGGDTEYWLAGKLHRIGGPAVTYGSKGPQHSEGTQEWWEHGKLLKTKKP